MEQRDARFSKMAREKGSDENGISFGYHPGHAPAEDEGGEVERRRREGGGRRRPRRRGGKRQRRRRGREADRSG